MVLKAYIFLVWIQNILERVMQEEDRKCFIHDLY